MAAVSTMTYVTDDSATLTPRDISEGFKSAYRQVHHREAQVVHMFAEWYQVNGETVHRIILFQETARLLAIVRQQEAQKPKPQVERGVIQRLIARLRGA